MITREEILAQLEQKPVMDEVFVPGWGKKVFVRAWSAQARFEFHRLVAQQKKAKVELIEDVWMIITSVCNEHGELLFRAEDYGRLALEDYIKVIKPLSDKCEVMNGYGAEQEEEIKKNS